MTNHQSHQLFCTEITDNCSTTFHTSSRTLFKMTATSVRIEYAKVMISMSVVLFFLMSQEWNRRLNSGVIVAKRQVLSRLNLITAV